MQKHGRSDLACEIRVAKTGAGTEGITTEELRLWGREVLHTHIEAGEGERLSGKPAGTYFTVYCGELCPADSGERLWVRNAVADVLRTLIASLLPSGARREKKVLVAGLGNRFITADAIGPLTVDKLIATRHLQRAHPELLRALGGCELSLVAPGVTGQTGFESAETIQGAVTCAAPDLLIVIDALAARSCKRLGTTVQISDTGLQPGSGIGNHRLGLNRESMGVPVIAIGVPTVVSSATLIEEALAQSGTEENDAMETLLRGGEGFFVSPKEMDVIADEAASLLSEAITEALNP